MSNRRFRKWRRWLDRILVEQLTGLIGSQQVFRQLGACTAPYAGTTRSADLAAWMTQGYIAFAATTVRRMLEEPTRPPKPKLCPTCGTTIVKPKPQDSLSLVVLLRDIEHAIEQNATLFTRSSLRKRYTDKNLPARFGGRDFNKISRSKTAKALSASRVRREIDTLNRVARPVRRLVNKAVAHTSRDRRKLGRTTFQQLNDAIDALAETYRLYSILIVGSCPDPLVPEDEYDVVADFKRVWP